MGDRRRVEETGRLQLPALTAPRESAVEEKADAQPEEKQQPLEWLLVVWPGLLVVAAALLGGKAACSRCGREGTVVRVVSLEGFRRSHRGGFG